MPQFDQIDTFASQIFWLIVFFLLLYLLMSQIVLPRIGHILEIRRAKIEEDLAVARQAHKEAEEIMANVETQINTARQDARKMVSEAETSRKAEMDEQTKHIEARLNVTLTEAEKRINQAIENARKDVASLSDGLAKDIVGDVLNGKAN